MGKEPRAHQKYFSKLFLFQGPRSPAARRIGTRSWARIHRIDEPSTEDPEIASILNASQ